ncbi:MAG TPA: SRPBCC family protein [Methylocystis sp.]|jgi:hypothetical protein
MFKLSRRAALIALTALASLASAAAAGAEPPTPGPNSWAAHGAAPLKSVETITIDAPPEIVWAVVSDFAHYDWLPGVARVEASGGETPEKAKRRLVMADGGVVEETLVRWDAERMTLAWHRDHDDVRRLPAINYMTHVTVKPAGEGKSLAEWKGRFYRGHPFNDPPPGLDDDTALAAVTALHKANLTALKARVEGR